MHHGVFGGVLVMICPKCHAPEPYISRTLSGSKDRVKRTRRCADCGYRFETVEVPASTLRMLEFQAAMHRIVNGNGKE